MRQGRSRMAIIMDMDHHRQRDMADLTMTCIRCRDMANREEEGRIPSITCHLHLVILEVWYLWQDIPLCIPKSWLNLNFIVSCTYDLHFHTLNLADQILTTPNLCRQYLVVPSSLKHRQACSQQLSRNL